LDQAVTGTAAWRRRPPVVSRLPTDPVGARDRSHAKVGERDHREATYAPQPTLGQLDELVEEVRASGIPAACPPEWLLGTRTRTSSWK
jgi:hypothetical protein